MFLVNSKDNKSNSIIIQGAFSRAGSNQDIARILFRNYDDDTGICYDMAAVCMRDADGGATTNGSGNLVVQTASNGILRDVAEFRSGDTAECTQIKAYVGDMLLDELKIVFSSNTPPDTQPNLPSNVLFSLTDGGSRTMTLGF